MVNLKEQYKQLKPEIDTAIADVIDSGQFIQGELVTQFESELSNFLGTRHVISCASGTDAIRLALMALDLPPDSEIIIPAFNYIAAIEVVSLEGFTPVLVDVHLDTFNIDPESLNKALTAQSRAIIATHLFGQCADMTAIMDIAKKNNLYVIEDNAQSLGANHLPTSRRAGTIGHIGCYSFFPSKILGAYGDGGALSTDDESLAKRIRELANHGQVSKYNHSHIGLNSRLDTIQAAILSVKLKHIDSFIQHRQTIAANYMENLHGINILTIPKTSRFSDHVYHQFTLRLPHALRGDLIEHLHQKKINAIIYYPKANHNQRAYNKWRHHRLPNSEKLCTEVLSIPICSSLTREQQSYICHEIKSFLF